MRRVEVERDRGREERESALPVRSPAAIALAIQMYSFGHANKAHLN